MEHSRPVYISKVFASVCVCAAKSGNEQRRVERNTAKFAYKFSATRKVYFKGSGGLQVGGHFKQFDRKGRERLRVIPRSRRPTVKKDGKWNREEPCFEPNKCAISNDWLSREIREIVVAIFVIIRSTSGETKDPSSM